MIIKFTQSQSESCLYPIGCPVWIFSRDPLYDDISASSTFKRGKVDSISMNFTSKQLIYDVIIEGGGNVSVFEGDMGFASGCAVNVAPENGNDGELVRSGSVLMCKRAKDGLVYTICFDGMFQDNIDFGRVTYRQINGCAVKSTLGASEGELSLPLKGNTETTVDVDRPKNTELVASENVANNIKKSCLPQSTKPDDETFEHLPEESALPTSITCVDKGISDAKLSDTTSMSVSGNTVSSSSSKRHATKDNHSEINCKRQKVDQRGDVVQEPSKGRKYHMHIRVPLWLQRDKVVQRRLFFYLLRSKAATYGDTIDQIQQDTGCRIVVNYDEHSGVKPITIDIDDFYCTAPVSRNLVVARRRIEDILMNFCITGSHPIKEDGSKGRLLYEILANCVASHGDRPKESTSNIVNQLNPFDPNQKHRYMSLLELPFTLNSVNKIFHGHFLLDSKVMMEVKNHTGCNYMVIGGDFGPVARYCDPYVLVFGHNWKGVDQAMEILKGETRKHQRGYPCSY